MDGISSLFRNTRTAGPPGRRAGHGYDGGVTYSTVIQLSPTFNPHTVQEGLSELRLGETRDAYVPFLLHPLEHFLSRLTAASEAPTENTRFNHGFGRGSCQANATCSSTGSCYPPGAECTHRTYGEPPARLSHRVYQRKGTPRIIYTFCLSQRAFHELLPDAIRH